MPIVKWEDKEVPELLTYSVAVVSCFIAVLKP
jgi:hypothetical protein